MIKLNKASMDSMLREFVIHDCSYQFLKIKRQQSHQNELPKVEYLPNLCIDVLQWTGETSVKVRETNKSCG
jgi:hypothetical protein